MKKLLFQFQIIINVKIKEMLSTEVLLEIILKCFIKKC